MAHPHRPGKLRWLCRRGMKELDVLFEAFLEQHHAQLNSGAFPEFEALLGHEDDQLWDWVQQDADTIPAHYRDLLELIRHHA